MDPVRAHLSQMRKLTLEETWLQAQGPRDGYSRSCFSFSQRYFEFQVTSPLRVFPFLRERCLELAVLRTKEWLVSQLPLLVLPLLIPMGVLY